MVSAYDDLRFNGEVFVDGSCDTASVKETRRAGFAVTDVDGTNIIRGTVPAWLPQSPQSAEYCAAAIASAALRTPCIVVGECANVIRDWHCGRGLYNQSKKVTADSLTTGLSPTAA